MYFFYTASSTPAGCFHWSRRRRRTWPGARRTYARTQLWRQQQHLVLPGKRKEGRKRRRRRPRARETPQAVPTFWGAANERTATHKDMSRATKTTTDAVTKAMTTTPTTTTTTLADLAGTDTGKVSNPGSEGRGRCLVQRSHVRRGPGK